MKYKFNGQVKSYNTPFGETVELRRVVATKDFGDVKAGSIGGWIESETNLSQDGDCWVYDEAVVAEGAVVNSGATVSGISFVGGTSILTGTSRVGDVAAISGTSIIEQNAMVGGNSVVHNSVIREEAKVIEESRVYDSRVEERAKIMGSAELRNVEVRGCARVMSKCTMTPIQFSGTIKDVTIADDEMCCGCVSMSFADWVKLAASPEKDFVASLMLASNEFSDVKERFSETQAGEIYHVLRKSLGFLGRIAQVYGRDVSGFTYIDNGYKLIVDPEMTDPINTENTIDPNHFFE